MTRDEVELNQRPPGDPTELRSVSPATPDKTKSPLSTASSTDDFFSPSPSDNIFSPAPSTATDITDDYGWETPVKGQPISPTINNDLLVSHEGEDRNELNGNKGRTGRSRPFDAHSPTNIRRRAKSASSFKLRPRASSVESDDARIASLSKLKDVSNSSVDGNAWVFDREALEGLIALTRPKTPKRQRQTKLECCVPEQARKIDITFSTSQTWILRARSASDIGAAAKKHPSDPVISCTPNQGAEQTRPSNQTILEITISPPKDTRINSSQNLNDESKPYGGSVSLGDGTIQTVLSHLSSQTSCAIAKGQVPIQASLSKIIPIEIREHLREDSWHCPATTTKGLRCKKHHKANLAHTTHLLDNLAMIKPSQAFKYLDDLISATLCSATHQRVARKELEKWATDIEKLCEINKDINYTVFSNNRLLALADWLNILSDGKGFSQKVSSSTPPSKIKETNPSNDSPQVLRLIQDFKPYITKDSARLSVSEAIEKLLLEPIKKKTEIERVGIVYVYWQPGNFGHLKIGYSQDFHSRMKAWNSRCKKAMEVYFPQRGSDEENLRVSHVCRVEKLVHMELKNLRRIEKNCPGCGKDHHEWFEVSRDLAIAVVRKWMAWMRESPYEKRSSGGKVEWVLKEEQRKKLKEVSVSRQAMERESRKDLCQAQRLSAPGVNRTRVSRLRGKSM
jgi:T5orf172 domain